MDAKDNSARGSFVSHFPPCCSCEQCPENRTPEKMKRLDSANLLVLAALLLNYLWKVSSLNVRTCEGYAGRDEVYHSGFYCPRLSDPNEHLYCCWTGNDSLKYCCSKEEFESIMKVNLSEVFSTYIHRYMITGMSFFARNPIPLLGIGFYGLLILSLMMVDFLYYYRQNKNTFFSMLSQTWVGKHLLCFFCPRNTREGLQRDNNGVRDVATQRMSQDMKCDKKRPLEGRV
uniref:Shisa N-terminal domain-containing protein n=1 Tax=Leptobrachium leishanense TaxID=445787 RepID=A0A8C5M0X2_9ANUR